MGDNSYGQLGNNGKANAIMDEANRYQTEPVKVMDGVAAVSCGSDYTGAIKTDGSLWMWGNNERGQLGNGTYSKSNIPIKVIDGVAAVHCSSRQFAAIKRMGYSGLGAKAVFCPIRPTRQR